MASWEYVCSGCGLCCYEREVHPDGAMYVDLTSPCRFFDEETKRCVVYDSRFDECEECSKITLRKALSSYVLPPSCAYRRLFEQGGYE